MKAIVQHRYGSPELLTFDDIDRPEPKNDEVLVRVQATSVNAYDCHMLSGTPYLLRLQAGMRTPKQAVPGVDLAGTVEAVGRDVAAFRVGDEVLGMRSGAFAEYVCVREPRIVPKPAGLSFEHAAALPMAAVTALQGLRDKGGIRPGHAVLVNGASGGVGTFAVQLAKFFGAEVTGVCSTPNVDLVRSIGADHVVDYTQDDFIRTGRRYDVILDIAGSRSLLASRRVLAPEGRLVVVGGAIASAAVVVVAAKLGSKRMIAMLAQPNPDDLAMLADLAADGTITPVVDRCYPLSAVAEALAYVGTRRARGKVLITG